MQTRTQNIYGYCVHNQGRYTLLLVALSVFTLPILDFDRLVALPLFVTLLGLAMGLLLVKPHWQPAFLRMPAGFTQCLLAMLASSAIFVVAMMLGYMAVLNMGLDEPLSRQIALLTVMPSLAVTGAMWWSALALMTNKPPAAKAPPEAPRPVRVSAQELHSLRKSRNA